MRSLPRGLVRGKERAPRASTVPSSRACTASRSRSPSTTRPHFEVLLAPAASPDGRTGAFRPHMLVRNDTDGADMDRMGGVRCWVEVLYSDGMDARVSLDGEVWNIADISNEDLLGIADRTEALMLEGAPFDSEEASPGRA